MRYLPNILTVMRICLVPIFPFVFFSGGPNSHYQALGIYILASMTDVLDGYLARRYDLVTVVGTVLDPLADKLMLLMAVTCLYVDQTLPAWAFLFILFSEVFMIITGFYMYFRKKHFVIPSNRYGKGATIIFFIGVAINILFPNLLISILVFGFALILKLIAIFSYATHYFQHQNKA
ncbi:CDP-alcohol phosphatidyltransferase family protein [Clostridia bacterium]|nr:CDP-alcohol phosphatidyltransferase family protein [Clostridia bacterium]